MSEDVKLRAGDFITCLRLESPRAAAPISQHTSYHLKHKIISFCVCMSVEEPPRTCKCIRNLAVTIIAMSLFSCKQSSQIAFLKQTLGAVCCVFNMCMFLFIQVWPSHSYRTVFSITLDMCRPLTGLGLMVHDLFGRPLLALVCTPFSWCRQFRICFVGKTVGQISQIVAIHHCRIRA